VISDENDLLLRVFYGAMVSTSDMLLLGKDVLSLRNLPTVVT